MQTDTGKKENGGVKAEKPGRPPAIMRAVMIALFLLSFFCFPIAASLEGPRITYSSFGTEYSWMDFLLLPIPLANLILGIFYKRKGLKTTKNIVVGIIFTSLLCIFGSYTLLFRPYYSNDTAYLKKVSSEIHFVLPDQGHITTQSFADGSGADSSSKARSSSPPEEGVTDYGAMSKIEFSDSGQLRSFESSLKTSGLWTTSVTTPLSGIVPELYSAQSSAFLGFDHFMVYNADLGTYNTLPGKNGSYRIFYLAYSSSKKQMFIGEYTYRVVL